MTQPTITQLRKGQSATIVGYLAQEVPIKVYEMGLLPGVVLTMKQQLPFNGPVCIAIKDNPNTIALRRSEADLILVESLR
jgi:Fe2+ transport system protein A